MDENRGGSVVYFIVKRFSSRIIKEQGIKKILIYRGNLQIERPFANRKRIAAIKRSKGANRNENSANSRGESANRKAACK
jgi:hypothetical protein